MQYSIREMHRHSDNGETGMYPSCLLGIVLDRNRNIHTSFEKVLSINVTCNETHAVSCCPNLVAWHQVLQNLDLYLFETCNTI